MHPSSQSQSEAHRLRWRQLNNPNQLPPETIAQLQWCAECLAEMEGQSILGWPLSETARATASMPLIPATDIMAPTNTMFPLGMGTEDIELPTSPHLVFKTSELDKIIPTDTRSGLPAPEDSDWNKLLEELEKQREYPDENS